MTAPVFVDDSGRRARWLRGACWVVASALFAYVVVVAAALMAPAHVLGLRIPGLGAVVPEGGAPSLTTGDGAPGVPSTVVAVLPTPSPRPTGRPSPTLTPSARPSQVPTAVPSVVPSTGAPSVQPSPAATRPTPRASGRPSDRPTPRATKTKPPRP